MNIKSHWMMAVHLLVLILLMADYGHASVGYRLTFKTASMELEAGTNAGISVIIYGLLNNGTTVQSDEFLLKSTAENFKQGGVDTFEIDGYYGAVYKLYVANDGSNSSPNWLIDEITLEDLQRDRPRSTTFAVNNWLANGGASTSMFLFIVVDGQYSPWSEWGDTCDTNCTCLTVCNGTQTRERACNDPPPFQGGKDCAEQGPAIEERQCENFCVNDGGVSQWSTWSTCSKACDTGQQNRSRTCTEPEQLNGGKECTETLFEEQDCNTQSCIVDGEVSNWGDWSACSKTCGTGVQSRTRTCTNPAQQNGGQNCREPLEEPRHCNTTTCPQAISIIVICCLIFILIIVIIIMILVCCLIKRNKRRAHGKSQVISQPPFSSFATLTGNVYHNNCTDLPGNESVANSPSAPQPEDDWIHGV